jgi:ABC-2 type transport system permease protein
MAKGYEIADQPESLGLRPRPRMPAPRLLTQFWVMFRLQLARVRLAWRPYMMVSTVMPLGIVLLVYLIGRGTDLASTGAQVVAGNVVLSLTITCVSMLAQRVAWMKRARAFDYYATLPVSLILLLLAIPLSFLAFALPGMVIVLAVGALLFHVAVRPNPEFLIFIPFAAAALSGIGAYLGLIARDDQLAAVYGNLVMMLILFLGSIVPTHLPYAVQVLRWLVPSTYAVEALRESFRGPIPIAHLILYPLALTGFAAVLLTAAAHRIEWRSE